MGSAGLNREWLPQLSPNPPSAGGPPPPPGEPGRPEIIVGGRQLREETAEGMAAVQQANNPPRLFVRGGLMIEVARDEKGRHSIREVSESILRNRLTQSANFYKKGAKGLIAVPPPLEVVRDIQSLPAERWALPSLDAVVSVPPLRGDGTISVAVGYDPSTSLYYAPDPGFDMPALEEFPGTDHIDAAKDLIGELLDGFPFSDPASRVNAVAALLTPIVRSAIEGPTPAFLFDAPQAGTGKSLLADVVAILATGRPGEMWGAPEDPEEWRKLLTTTLMGGAVLVIVDNVTRRLDNGDLAKVLTETLHADRAFRTHQKIVLPVRCTWILTGNNLRLGGDLPRRCVWVRLDAKTSTPFLRTGFKIEDLKSWALSRRPELCHYTHGKGGSDSAAGSGAAEAAV